MTNKASLLRELFKTKKIIRIVGAHDGLGAKLIERHGFDGVWASGFEISTSHGVPDADILSMSQHLDAARMINRATVLPVLCDCDAGFGNVNNVIHMVEEYEASGMAGIVIEDKKFPKVNSFVNGRQELLPIQEFVQKIKAAKSAQTSVDFMVFARIESLIAGQGMDEALRRADAYELAGADGIVIHSKSRTPDEVYSFVEKWQGHLPIVVIPTTYFSVTADELAAHGFKMAIYANHGIRAAIRAMDDVMRSIAEQGTTSAVEPSIAPLQEAFDLQGIDIMIKNEKRFAE